MVKVNLDANRVPFKKNRNRADDSDYDDEDDSKIESCDDLASVSEMDQQDGAGGKSKMLADGSQMFDDLRRPDGDERQSLIEKDKDGNQIDTRQILKDDTSVKQQDSVVAGSQIPGGSLMDSHSGPDGSKSPKGFDIGPTKGGAARKMQDKPMEPRSRELRTAMDPQ